MLGEGIRLAKTATSAKGIAREKEENLNDESLKGG